MRYAAVERLTKLISDDSARNSQGGKGYRSRKPIEIHFGLAEGWFSLFLLATVVYSTIWSVQLANWVEHLNLLTLITAVGLVSGLISAKQQRLPRVAVHLVILILGLFFAFWQTAGAFYQGNITALTQGIYHWYLVTMNGGGSNDDSIFLFLILSLGFILAYTSAWLVYRMRSPWLMIVANAIVLLINLSNLSAGYLVFLVVFLIASLLLLLRFNLYESIQRWHKQGLRYGDDIGWDVMQAGVLISLGILICSWILPGGYTNPVAAQIWNVSSNPWIQVQNTWNRAFPLSGGTNPANHGNFRDTLVLGGNPNLNHDVVFNVQTDGNGSQYLQFLSYDTYSDSGWTVSAVDKLPVKANEAVPPSASMTHPEKQVVTVVSPPGEQYPYLSGASEISSISVPANALFSQATGSIVSWIGQNGNLPAGTHYTVTSSISSADVKTLQALPMPDNAPQYNPNFDGPLPPSVYNSNVAQTYLQLPKDLDPQIAALAQKITAHAPTMYDKMVALETYLRSHYTYSVDIQRPPGEEGVSWFLFRSGNKGFCNYFASAMSVMARSIGVPARVAVGYTNGTYDGGKHQWVIRGSDAHAWTQVYFAGYGWINFEPSASFATFDRPLPSQFSSSGTNNNGTNANKGAVPPDIKARGFREPADLAGGNNNATTSRLQAQAQLRQNVSITLGSLVLVLLFACMLFSLWWRRLFRRYDQVVQLYGRLCLLASWAGIHIEPAQTPHEYLHEIALSTPGESVTIERLGDIYVRSQWADPKSKEHPRSSGEMDELPGLWRHLQPRLFLHVLRHPYFLRRLPEYMRNALSQWRSHRRARRLSNGGF